MFNYNYYLLYVDFLKSKDEKNTTCDYWQVPGINKR